MPPASACFVIAIGGYGVAREQGHIPMAMSAPSAGVMGSPQRIGTTWLACSYRCRQQCQMLAATASRGLLRNAGSSANPLTLSCCLPSSPSCTSQRRRRQGCRQQFSTGPGGPGYESSRCSRSEDEPRERTVRWPAAWRPLGWRA